MTEPSPESVRPLVPGCPPEAVVSLSEGEAAVPGCWRSWLVDDVELPVDALPGLFDDRFGLQPVNINEATNTEAKVAILIHWECFLFMTQTPCLGWSKY